MKRKITLMMMLGFALSACNSTTQKVDDETGSPEIYDPKAISELEPDSIDLRLEKGTFRVAVLKNDSLAVIEGDIIIRLAKEKDSLTKGIRSWGIVGKKWAGNVVYYAINPSTPNQAAIADAISYWKQTVPGIKFEKHLSPIANFIDFVPGAGPSSEVGMIGGRQEITVSASTSKGNIIHEIGHALGLWHEHTRSDRDKYITVDLANVKEKFKFNFNIQPGEPNGTSYDYGSIMHYPTHTPDFAVDPAKPVITPKITVAIGQRLALSAQDIAGVKKRYGL